MATGSGVLRLARGRSSAIDLDTEEGRAFLQERLAFYNKVCFLLTGQHVFSGATLVEVCSHHLHTRPVPPSEKLGRTLPEPIEALVLACLEKDKARRPAGAAELRSRLGTLAAAYPWTEDDARAWWEWRERPDRSAAPKDEFSGTLGVSLLDRSS